MMTNGGDPNSELERAVLRGPGAFRVPESMVAWAQQFQDAMMMYNLSLIHI